MSTETNPEEAADNANEHIKDAKAVSFSLDDFATKLLDVFKLPIQVVAIGSAAYALLIWDGKQDESFLPQIIKIGDMVVALQNQTEEKINALDDKTNKISTSVTNLESFRDLVRSTTKQLEERIAQLESESGSQTGEQAPQASAPLLDTDTNDSFSGEIVRFDGIETIEGEGFMWLGSRSNGDWDTEAFTLAGAALPTRPSELRDRTLVAITNVNVRDNFPKPDVPLEDDYLEGLNIQGVVPTGAKIRVLQVKKFTRASDVKVWAKVEANFIPSSD